MNHHTPRSQVQRRWPALALLSALALSACGGGSSGTTTTTTTTATVPGAPTIGVASAGNASASIGFAAPGSDGGSAITGYTATCTAGAASITGTATTSPVVVSGLTNATLYSCVVRASNAVGSGAASAAASVTPQASSSAGSTAGAACGYSHSAFNGSASVQLTSTATWTCGSTSRVLSANGVPDHAVGTFPNPGNPNTITTQAVSASYTLTPSYLGTVSNTGGPAGTTGFVLNGVKIDAGTGGSCDNSGSACSLGDNSGAWSIEALGQTSFNFGTDSNNAHVQPGGVYHYHGMPEGFIALQGGNSSKMTLIGWAADGFPIYARYGYAVATDSTSAIRVMKGSWRTLATPGANRPSTSLYPMGSFRQDWEYVAGLGDLDECYGRTGVTPEFPLGIYHYYATDSYPYLQRCVKGRR